MTETFACDDKEQLVAYLYDELGDAARARVDVHVRHCDSCAGELAGLGGVRRELAGWSPPDVALGFSVVSTAAAPASRSVWREVPAWAQLAAAVLVMGIGLAVANLQVRYGEAGLVVTTGWMTPVAAPVPEVAQAVAAPATDEAWRAELAALEQRIRDAMPASPPLVAASDRASAPAVDTEALLRQVNALVEASELRQRQELAYRLTQFNRDMEMQRRADLVRIERGVGQIEGRTGAEVARQREMLNYLVRASQRPQEARGRAQGMRAAGERVDENDAKRGNRRGSHGDRTGAGRASQRAAGAGRQAGGSDVAPPSDLRDGRGAGARRGVRRAAAQPRTPRAGARHAHARR
jgi:hypothetical protein